MTNGSVETMLELLERSDEERQGVLAGLAAADKVGQAVSFGFEEEGPCARADVPGGAGLAGSAGAVTLRVVECKGCVLCRSLSVTVLGRVCGRRRRRPRRGSLEVACVRVAVTAYSRVDGVWCHTYAIAATRHTLSSRRGGRHRREIRRDNGIHGTPGRHRAAHRRPGVVERRRRRDLSGPVATRPGRPPRASKVPSRMASICSQLCSGLLCSRRPGPPGRSTSGAVGLGA